MQGRWSQEEKVPWEKPEVPTEEPKLEEPERPSDRSDRPSDDGGWVWSGWSSSWYGNGRPWSSWSSYPYGYGYGGYGYSGYSSWDERWARPDAPEAKQDDSQNRQERWSQAFSKDRQELQEGAWWKSERDERSKENIASEARQAEEGSQEPKWVPITSSGLETSSATGTPQALQSCKATWNFAAASSVAVRILERQLVWIAKGCGRSPPLDRSASPRSVLSPILKTRRGTQRKRATKSLRLDAGT